MSSTTILKESSPPHAKWTSPEVQLERLQWAYATQLNEILPVVALANIVSSYTGDSLGANADNWYKALKKLNLLPSSIPPLPQNICEILASTCPIEGAPQRLTDTHSLLLIPGGPKQDIDEFVKHFNVVGEKEFLGPEHRNLRPGILKGLRTPESVGFPEPVWILVSGLVPKSPHYNKDDQFKMIEKLQRKTFINYEVPLFKYALAASLLKITADGEGLWKSEKKDRALTRVQEAFAAGALFGLDHSLTIGNCRDKRGRIVADIDFIPYHMAPAPERDLGVGIAGMWVGFSPKPIVESSCAVS